MKDDYAAAELPTLPTVTSQRSTAWQVVLYIALLLAMAWLPLVSGYGGFTFAIVASLLSLQWLRKSHPLFGDPTRQETVSAYKYSLLYLAGAFLVLAIEPLFPWY